MQEKRSLLFYEHGENKSTNVIDSDSNDLDKTIAWCFSTGVSLVIKASIGLPSEQYNFYDWNLSVLTDDTKVANVPNPGIVIAVKKSHTSEAEASGVKFLIEKTAHGENRRVLDSYLKGDKGRLPSHLKGVNGQQLIDAIEAKPGVFGVHLDLKKVVKAIFRRNRR